VKKEAGMRELGVRRLQTGGLDASKDVFE